MSRHCGRRSLVVQFGEQQIRIAESIRARPSPLPVTRLLIYKSRGAEMGRSPVRAISTSTVELPVRLGLTPDYYPNQSNPVINHGDNGDCNDTNLFCSVQRQCLLFFRPWRLISSFLSVKVLMMGGFRKNVYVHVFHINFEIDIHVYVYVYSI